MTLFKRLAILLCCLPFFVFANVFVVGDKALLNPKTLNLIDTIGAEFFQKTNIAAYVLLKDQSYSKEQRQSYLNEIQKDLHSPFVLIYFFKEDKKIGFLSSDGLKDLIDIDSIYQDYMVPLLPIKKTDVLDQNRISAIVLNGYTHLINAIADKKDVKILSNIVDKSGELLAKTARFTMQIMLFVMACFVIWFYIIRRKK